MIEDMGRASFLSRRSSPAPILSSYVFFQNHDFPAAFFVLGKDEVPFPSKIALILPAYDDTGKRDIGNAPPNARYAMLFPPFSSIIFPSFFFFFFSPWYVDSGHLPCILCPCPLPPNSAISPPRAVPFPPCQTFPPTPTTHNPKNMDYVHKFHNRQFAKQSFLPPCSGTKSFPPRR